MSSSGEKTAIERSGRTIHASESCVFCQRITSPDVVAQSELAVAFPDAYPVSRGHTLIVPRRHESDFFALSEQEQRALFDLVVVVKSRLDGEFRPDGYNLGLNAGADAGQTVPHAHLHIIPRYHGDAVDPRGGVRWVLPDRAAYWHL